MKRVSNVNRKASANAIIQQVATLKTVAGLTIQTHRAYESPSRGGKGLRQKEVKDKAGSGVSTTAISWLENGRAIPRPKALESILKASGFHLTKRSGGSALLALLKTIKSYETTLKKLRDEKPD